MRMYQDTRRLDFHALGREIKRKREAKGWTQEYLAQLVDRTPRSIMYFENRGQHPSLNTFYQIVTLLDISVDQFFYPDRQNGESDCRQHIDRLLNTMDEKELTFIEALSPGGAASLLFRRLQGRGKPQKEPGAHEKKAAEKRIDLLRFARRKSPVFRDFFRLFSGPEYPNTFRPGLTGYFVTFMHFGPTWPEAGKEETT